MTPGFILFHPLHPTLHNNHHTLLHLSPSLLSLFPRRNEMASLTCTPTSLQLRLAFAAPKFPHPPHVRMRNFKLNRLRPLRAAQDGVSSEWAGPGPKLDGFSGWSDTDAEQRPNNAPKKDSYGGECGSPKF